MTDFALATPPKLAPIRRKTRTLRAKADTLRILRPTDETPLDDILAALPDDNAKLLVNREGELEMKGISTRNTLPYLDTFAQLDHITETLALKDAGLELLLVQHTPYRIDFEVEDIYEQSFEGEVLVVGQGGVVQVTSQGDVRVWVNSRHEVCDVQRNNVALRVNGDVLLRDYDDDEIWYALEDEPPGPLDDAHLNTITARLNAITPATISEAMTHSLLVALARFFIPMGTHREGWGC